MRLKLDGQFCNRNSSQSQHEKHQLMQTYRWAHNHYIGLLVKLSFKNKIGLFCRKKIKSSLDPILDKSLKSSTLSVVLKSVLLQVSISSSWRIFVKRKSMYRLPMKNSESCFTISLQVGDGYNRLMSPISGSTG